MLFLTAFDGGAEGDLAKRLAKLREQILMPHVWFTWRHRSFGSSANNHLLGEISGLALAVSRWPGLAKLGPTPRTGCNARAGDVAQFHADGGNFEQALNYHFYSGNSAGRQRRHWMLLVSCRVPGERIRERLGQAARFS